MVCDGDKNPRDVGEDKTEVYQKEVKGDFGDQSFDKEGSSNIESNQAYQEENKISASLEVDDGEEDCKDVGCNKNVDEEMVKWIRAVGPS